MSERPTLADVLEGRHAIYGAYDNVARLSQDLKRALRRGPTWHALSDAQRESCEMIANKLARIANGADPGYVDSWRDISGYAELVVRELERPPVDHE